MTTPIKRKRPAVAPEERMKVVATYTTFTEFIIPKGITLLNENDNKNAADKTPFSWGIKYNTLRYYDYKGELQSIESYNESCDMKWPDSVEIESAEDWDCDEDE